MKIHVAEQTPRPLNSPVTLAMAIFKRSNGFALTKQCWSCLVGMHLLFGTLPGCSFITPAFAHDNSVAPAVEGDKQARSYTSGSIHLGGERWIAAECVKTQIDGNSLCELFLYKLLTQHNQESQSSSAYVDAGTKAPQSGRWVVAVRKPLSTSGIYEELRRTFKQSEILQMRPYGRDIRMCAIPKDHLHLPSLSPNESKIAYSESLTTRQFAAEAADTTKNLLQMSFNEVYLEDRWQSYLSESISVETENAKLVAIDQLRAVYLLGEQKNFGLSIFKFNQKSDHWHTPIFRKGGVAALSPSSDGSHIGIVYPLNLLRLGNATSILRQFDMSTKRRIPVNPSPIESTVPEMPHLNRPGF